MGKLIIIMEEFKEMTVDKFIKKQFLKVRAKDSIKKVIRIFEKEDISVLPVMKGKKLIGEIHEIDLLKLLVDLKDIPEEDVTSLGFSVDMGYIAKTAEQIMRRHDIIIEPKTKIKDAAYTMLKEGVSKIPVMKKKSLIGILSEKKLLEELIKRRKI